MFPLINGALKRVLAAAKNIVISFMKS
jgi:hypothetical protein